MDVMEKKTLQEILPKIDESIQYLKACTDYASLEAYHHFVVISENVDPDESKNVHQVALCKHVVESGICSFFPKMWKTLHVYLKENEQVQGLRNVHEMIGIFANVADFNEECGIALAQCGAISLLLEGLETLKTKPAKNEIMSAMFVLSMLHNVIHASPATRSYYRACNAVASMKSCLELGYEWQTNALLVLAYVATDSEKKELASTHVGVSILIDIFKAAVVADNHRDGGCSAFETLDAINHLAINDDVKEVIAADKDAIPCIVQLLENGFSPEEQKVAAEALWNLAFIESMRQSEILQAAIPALKRLAKSTNKDVRVACASALFEIQGSIADEPTSSEGNTSRSPPPSYQEAISEPASPSPTRSVQVMISYQWDSQERAKQIRNNLLHAGYRVWMDVTNIRGDILSAMADAIHTSDVILICMTERYKDSQNCRSEATFAYKLKKKIIPLVLQKDYEPDGWLAFLQGMNLYYSLHSDDQLQRNMCELLKAIAEYSGRDEADGPIRQSKRELQGASPPPKTSASAKQPAAAEWSKEEVQRWLKDQDLKKLCKKFKKFNGTHLQEMYSSMGKNEDKFTDELKSDYGMKADVRTRFVVALRAAFKE